MELKTRVSGVTVVYDTHQGMFNITTSQRINPALAALLPYAVYTKGNLWYCRINLRKGTSDGVIEELFAIRKKIKHLQARILNGQLTEEEENRICNAETLIGLTRFFREAKHQRASYAYYVELLNKYNITLNY